MTAADDDDYQHWGEDDEYLKQPAVLAPGYDSHNGLRAHTYYNEAPVSAPPSPAAPKTMPQPYPLPQLMYSYAQPQLMPYPTAQYTYAQPPQMPYPAPAYYGHPQPGMPQQMAGYGGYQVYQPAYSAPKVLAAAEPVAQQPAQWIGRTKAQVEEDNMKIAAKEGAYDKRKVVPVGMKEDQMMWCVEIDGSHTLRTFVSMKELKGEWKKDPRYEDAYYFVREEEVEKKKD